MKRILSVAFIGILLNTSLVSFPAFAQDSWLAEREVQHCTTDMCEVTLVQWYSTIFNQAKWKLTIKCFDGSGEGTWEGDGVWGGTACHGKIGY